MKRPGQNVIVMVAAALLLGATGNVLAAEQTARHSARTSALTIKITDTGTLWGAVSLTYRHAGKTVHRSCKAAACRLSVPKGSQVKLSQLATDGATWPFSKWIIRIGSSTRTSSGSSMTVKFSKPMTVTAVYVLASSSSSSSGSGSAPGYGSGSGYQP